MSGREPLHICSFTQLCLTLCDPMDCSPPGSSVHGISQARILEWVVISSSRGSDGPRAQTCISCITGGFFTTQAINEQTVKSSYNGVILLSTKSSSSVHTAVWLSEYHAEGKNPYTQKYLLCISVYRKI